MKILIIHSHYNLPGGEDAVFFQEKELLSHSNIVDSITFQNRIGLHGFFQFLLSIWNISAAKKIEKKIRDFKPDIIHIHNLHFAIGPLAIRIAKKHKIPVILTLHNFRLLCPSGSLMYDGKIFLDSVNSNFPWQAILKRVYRNSLLQTFWLSFIFWFHRLIGTWNQVNIYICLTQFTKELFESSSLNVDSNKYRIKSNFIQTPKSNNFCRKNHFLFIGRLTVEKGVDTLLKAFSECDYNIRIAGDGPLLDKVKEYSKIYGNIEYVGVLNKGQVLSEMEKCTALIFPSLWYEGMPMTIIEAFSLGTPIIASRLGAMASMIINEYNGLHFEPDNSLDLINKLNCWMAIPDYNKKEFRDAALNTYLNKYTSEINLKELEDIYRNELKSTFL